MQPPSAPQGSGWGHPPSGFRHWTGGVNLHGWNKLRLVEGNRIRSFKHNLPARPPPRHFLPGCQKSPDLRKRLCCFLLESCRSPAAPGQRTSSLRYMDLPEIRAWLKAGLHMQQKLVPSNAALKCFCSSNSVNYNKANLRMIGTVSCLGSRASFLEPRLPTSGDAKPELVPNRSPRKVLNALIKRPVSCTSSPFFALGSLPPTTTWGVIGGRFSRQFVLRQDDSLGWNYASPVDSFFSQSNCDCSQVSVWEKSSNLAFWVSRSVFEDTFCGTGLAGNQTTCLETSPILRQTDGSCFCSRRH